MIMKEEGIIWRRWRKLIEKKGVGPKSGWLGSTSESLEEVRGLSKQHVLHREQRHQRSWRSEVQEREAGVAAPEGVSCKVLTDWKAHACY